jgi:hypothetical protein
MRCAEFHSYTNDTALRDYDKGYHAGLMQGDEFFSAAAIWQWLRGVSRKIGSSFPALMKLENFSLHRGMLPLLLPPRGTLSCPPSTCDRCLFHAL